MPACIICKTEEGDVKKGLEELRSRGKEVLNYLKDNKEGIPHIIQVGMRKYDNLKKASMDDVIKEIEKRHITHSLNLSTMTIHRKGCSHAGKNILTGYIVNDCVTGLHRCKHCLS